MPPPVQSANGRFKFYHRATISPRWLNVASVEHKVIIGEIRCIAKDRWRIVNRHGAIIDDHVPSRDEAAERLLAHWEENQDGSGESDREAGE